MARIVAPVQGRGAVDDDVGGLPDEDARRRGRGVRPGTMQAEGGGGDDGAGAEEREEGPFPHSLFLSSYVRRVTTGYG